MTRYEAFVALLALPDPPGMVRGHHQVCARSRDPWELKRQLGVAYVEHRRQDWMDGDISCVVAVRKLKIARRA